MDNITDILVIVNPLVRDQPAITKAVSLAKSIGAGIELLICDTKSTREAHTEGGLPAMSNALLRDNLDSLIEQMAEPLRRDGIDDATQVISGDPGDEPRAHPRQRVLLQTVPKVPQHDLCDTGSLGKQCNP